VDQYDWPSRLRRHARVHLSTVGAGTPDRERLPFRGTRERCGRALDIDLAKAQAYQQSAAPSTPRTTPSGSSRTRRDAVLITTCRYERAVSLAASAAGKHV